MVKKKTYSKEDRVCYNISMSGKGISKYKPITLFKKVCAYGLIGYGIVTITFPEMVMNKTVDQIIAIPGDTVTYDVYLGTTNPPTTKASDNQSGTSASDLPGNSHEHT